MTENERPRKTTPFFETINPSNLTVQINREAASQISGILIDAFEDSDSPSVWAFAKQLESFSKTPTHPLQAI